ncbi:MAG TPA: OmpA family protein, partial [Steroidobacteraceae bacterium]|nr:OmpA family protein [Steroidobacteraceae bacterium]
ENSDGAGPADTSQMKQAQDLKQASEKQQMLEHKQLESLMAELRAAVNKSQALQPFKDQLLLDITPEGVRIQIVDAQNRPMFDVGSARLRDYTSAILRELAPYLDSVPNRISLTGHTDIRPYPSSNGYTNWELSADRANAARRALTAAGLPDSKISRVVGLSSSVLFDKADPQNPINRRISIVVMTKQAEEDALKTDVAKESVAPGTTAASAAPDAAAPASSVPPPASAAPVSAAPIPATPVPAAPSRAVPATAAARPGT